MSTNDLTSGRSIEAVSYFISKGWSIVQSAALVGNLEGEDSTLIPTAHGDYSSSAGRYTAFGIAQWHDDRIKPILDHFVSGGAAQYPTAALRGAALQSLSFETQLAAVDWELNGSEKTAGNELRTATDITSAVHYIVYDYERPADKAGDTLLRIDLANNVYKLYTGENTDTPVNQPPATPIGHDQAVSAGTPVALTTLFTGLTDPDAGDSVVSFSVRDRTVGGGRLLFDGVVQAEDTVFTASIADLSHWSFKAGATAGTSDTIGFQTIDSHGASSTSGVATVTVQATASNNPPNTPTGHDQTVSTGASVALTTLFTGLTDPDVGDSIVSFSVRDRTVGGGRLLLDGVVQAEDTVFTAPIAELTHWSFRAGTTAGTSDTVGFQTLDSHGATSTSGVVTVTVQATASNNPPNTPTGHDQTVSTGASVALTTLFTGLTDPDAGDSIGSFSVRDRTVGGGRLLLDGAVQAEDTVFTAPIADLSRWSFRAGTTAGISDIIGFQTIDSHGAMSTSGVATITVQATASSQPEIRVNGNGYSITDGDTTPDPNDDTLFGGVALGGTPVRHTFTVVNEGSATLTTSGLTVPTGFSIVEGLSSSISPGTADTFTVQMDTGVAGSFAGDISFANNDADENPFNFRISGSVTSTQPTPQTTSWAIAAIDTAKYEGNSGPTIFNYTLTRSGTRVRRGR